MIEQHTYSLEYKTHLHVHTPFYLTKILEKKKGTYVLLLREYSRYFYLFSNLIGAGTTKTKIFAFSLVHKYQ